MFWTWYRVYPMKLDHEGLTAEGWEALDILNRRHVIDEQLSCQLKLYNLTPLIHFLVKLSAGTKLYGVDCIAVK